MAEHPEPPTHGGVESIVQPRWSALVVWFFSVIAIPRWYRGVRLRRGGEIWCGAALYPSWSLDALLQLCPSITMIMVIYVFARHPTICVFSSLFVASPIHKIILQIQMESPASSAMHSTSTKAPMGKAATPTHVLAGNVSGSVKY